MLTLSQIYKIIFIYLSDFNMSNIIKVKAYFMGLFNLLIFFSKRIIQSCLSSTYRKKLFRLFKDNKMIGNVKKISFIQPRRDRLNYFLIREVTVK